MLALPLNSGVGVKIAERVKPAPLSAPSVPPLTTMSLASKPLGSSLKSKLITAVLPALTTGTLEVIDSVGASVSIAISGVSASAPVLPAGSV